MDLFLIFSFYGIVSGAIYLIFCFIRRMFNFNLFIGIPIDILTGLVIGLIFFYCIMKFAFGEFRLYFLLAFLIGICILLITLKNFVATLSDFVYNIIRKLLFKLKNGRQSYGSSKTNKDC